MRFLKLSGVILAVAFASVRVEAYSPYHLILHSQCPTNNPRNSWREYMAAKFAAESCGPGWAYRGNPHPSCPSGTVGVQFRLAKQVNDPAALPGIDPRACYGIGYNGNKTYRSLRVYGYELMDHYPDNHSKQSLAGDPENYEINVDGLILKFNEAGEVFNQKGIAVGTLVCYRSNDCQKFGY